MMASPTGTASEPDRRLVLLLLTLVVGAGAWLRLHELGTTFQSSDNVELAVRVLRRPGYAWMMDEPYGMFISLWVKLWGGLVSALGIGLNEFWWKAAVALAGTLQVPVGYWAIRAMGGSRWAGLLGAAALAVLPIHIFQSRYLWGYEVLGALFILPALVQLFRFWAEPTRARGLRASLWVGLYLLSHGYFLPMAPVVVAMLCIFPEGENSWRRLLNGIVLLGKRLVWVFPLLFYPLYRVALRHALDKDSALGFYVDDHFMGFLGNFGIPLLVLIVGMPVVVWGMQMGMGLRAGRREGRMDRRALFLYLAGAIYFAPLFFGTPPGITVVRGYMLVGSVLWVVGCMILAGQLGRGIWTFVLIGVLWTGAGTARALFAWKAPWGTMVVVERGSVPKDAGTKAAGYLIREYVPAESNLVAIHRAVEPPNVWYYFGREDSAWFDLKLEQTLAKYRALEAIADVVVADRAQADSLNAWGKIPLQCTVTSWGEPQVYLFARPGNRLPQGNLDYSALNEAFDKKYFPVVNLF